MARRGSKRSGNAGTATSGFNWGKVTTIALAVTAVSGAVVAVSGGIPKLIEAVSGEQKKQDPATGDARNEKADSAQTDRPPTTIVRAGSPEGPIEVQITGQADVEICLSGAILVRRGSSKTRCTRPSALVGPRACRERGRTGRCEEPPAVLIPPDCQPGSARDGNGVCQQPERPPETKQCPDGSTIPVAQDCPRIEVRHTESVIEFFDWASLIVPACPPGWTRDGDGVCQEPERPPPETRQCPDGSIIPAGQQCPQIVEPFTGPFIVFFDWDKAEITPLTAAILDNVALAYRQYDRLGVSLAGHTDRSGADGYNVGLSQRRANAVRAYLARRGVPEPAITSQAYGESRPLLDTADGVREPQNRRVEIIFGPSSGW